MIAEVDCSGSSWSSSESAMPISSARSRPTAASGRRDWGRPGSRTNSGCRDSLAPASLPGRAPPRRQSPIRRGCAGAGIPPGPRPSRPTDRAGRDNPGSGSAANHSRAASDARRPIVTTCKPITSRSGRFDVAEEIGDAEAALLVLARERKAGQLMAASRGRTGSHRCPRRRRANSHRRLAGPGFHRGSARSRMRRNTGRSSSLAHSRYSAIDLPSLRKPHWNW